MKGLFKYSDSANWYFRYAGADGKRAVVALKTPDEAEAIKRAQTVLGADLVKPDKTPLDQIVERYLVAAKTRNRKPMREGTALSAKGNLMRFIGARGLKTPADVTAKNLQGWLDALRSKGKAQDTLFTYARDVCAFGKWLARERHVTFNPFENFERPEMSPKGRQNWIRREEFARLLEAATDPDLKFILYCGFHAGFRKAEICAARVGWFELNPEKPVVHIQNDPEAGFYLKDSDNRTVPLTKEFADFLRVFCQELSADQLCALAREGKGGQQVPGRVPQKVHCPRQEAQSQMHSPRHAPLFRFKPGHPRRFNLFGGQVAR